VQKKFQGWLQEGRIGSEKILLLKPATFMNESGRSVGEALRFYKLTPADLTVFHDELDLAPMKVKVRIGGGHAGHKDRVTGHVLGNYAKSEMDALADMLGAIAAEAEWLAKGDDVRFMSDVALRQAG